MVANPHFFFGMGVGLVNDPLLPFRVYVLQCKPLSVGGEPTYYVGIEHRSQIWRRLQSHKGQTETAAHFTKSHKPVQIELVWPAATRAAEAFVFYALLAKLPSNAVERLGGMSPFIY